MSARDDYPHLGDQRHDIDEAERALDEIDRLRGLNVAWVAMLQEAVEDAGLCDLRRRPNGVQYCDTHHAGPCGVNAGREALAIHDSTTSPREGTCETDS